MLKSLFLITTSLLVTNGCITWIEHKCQECAPNGGSLQGSQCVVGGMWYGCYQTIEACCDGWESHGELGWDDSSVPECVTMSNTVSGPSDPAPGKPWWEPGLHQVPTANAELPPDWSNWPMIALPTPSTSGCAAYVSITPGVQNSACRQFCADKNQANLATFCIYEYWGKSDGWSRFTEDGCYDNWIHGYSDEGNYGSGRTDLGGTTVAVVDTPQECQELCQKDANCVRFAFRSTSQESGINLPVGNCQLKPQDVLTQAGAITFPPSDNHQFVPPSTDAKWNWCNMGMNWQCWMAGFTCMPCSGHVSCIWVSANHVAGPKLCGQPRSGCSAVTPAPTAAPPAPQTDAPVPPTAPPTVAPTAPPTVAPTAPPTVAPTAPPTVAPTAPPTVAPTAPPTVAPTAPPTVAPTAPPTVAPTAPPTEAPAPPTEAPAPPTEAPAPPTEAPAPPTEAPHPPPTEAPAPPTDAPAPPTNPATPAPTDPAVGPSPLPSEPAEVVSTAPCEKPEPKPECPCASRCRHGGDGCSRCPCAALSLRVRDKPKFLNLVVKY